MAAADINSNNKKFPLSLRKQFRDNEAKLKTHLAAIQKAIGFAVTYEANGEPFYDAVADRREQLGDILYDTYPAEIKSCLEAFVTESKENAGELKLAMTAKKIIVRLVPALPSTSSYGYQQMLFEKGALVVQTEPTRFYCNMAQICSEGLLEAFKTVVEEKAECKVPEQCRAFPLHIRKSYQKNRKDLDAALAKIKKATGVDFVFKADYRAIQDSLKDNGDYNARVGEIIWEGVLSRVASAIEELCADSMSKEAFLEAVTKRIIEYQSLSANPSVAKFSGSYQFMFIDDGKLILGARPESIYTNLDMDLNKANLETLL